MHITATDCGSDGRIRRTDHHSLSRGDLSRGDDSSEEAIAWTSELFRRRISVLYLILLRSVRVRER
eukprot:5928491-Prymnesium_polylepis.1